MIGVFHAAGRTADPRWDRTLSVLTDAVFNCGVLCCEQGTRICVQ